jgi:glycosyltransferase involved in cell wall biosynthesis
MLSTRTSPFPYQHRALIVAPRVISAYEPFGLSILEAALLGCALVVGNIPSLRELWDEAAWFVGPDDPQELRHSLTTLVRDRTVREKLATRARQRARQYGLGRMAQQYLGVYQELVEGSGAICV